MSFSLSDFSGSSNASNKRHANSPTKDCKRPKTSNPADALTKKLNFLSLMHGRVVTASEAGMPLYTLTQSDRANSATSSIASEANQGSNISSDWQNLSSTEVGQAKESVEEPQTPSPASSTYASPSGLSPAGSLGSSQSLQEDDANLNHLSLSGLGLPETLEWALTQNEEALYRALLEQAIEENAADEWVEVLDRVPATPPNTPTSIK